MKIRKQKKKTDDPWAGVRPSLEITTNINGDQRPALLDPSDPHQAPNLAFMDFQSYSREVVHEIFVRMIGKPPKAPRLGGESMITLRVMNDTGGALMVDRNEYIKRLEKFVDVWIDRYITNGKLEVMPDGNLRRAIKPTMVHVDEPAPALRYCDGCGKAHAYICKHTPDADDSHLEDKPDDGVPHAEWLADTEGQAQLRERWRKAKPADLTVGQLEEIMKQ
jgi:hypothetical protein